jgi:hypothetical protein
VRTSLAIAAVVAGYTWIVEPRFGRGAVPLVAAVVLALGVRHAMRRGDWGWSWRALAPGLLAAAAFTVALAAGLLGVAGVLGQAPSWPVVSARAVTSDAAWLVLWAGAQQWLLQTTFLRDAEATTSRGRAMLIAPLLFGALHLPNPFLTVVTSVAAVGWCAIYARYPNVLPLAFSHAAGTVVIQAAFDEAVTGRLRVGSSYLQLGP